MSEQTRSESSNAGPPRRPDTLWATLRRFSRLWGFLIFLVVVVLLFRGIVLPFIFGLLVAYLLAPVVARLQPRIGRALAVITCYVVILGAFALFFGLLLPAVVHDLARLRDAAPQAIETFSQEWLPRAEHWIEEAFGDVLAEPGEPEVERPLPPSELVFEPMGDGTYRVDLEQVRMSARQLDDGTWIVGPPPPPEETGANLGDSLRSFIAGRSEDVTRVIGPALQALVTGVAGFVTNFIITFMVAGFVLVDMARVNRFVRSLIPYEYRVDFEELWAAGDKGLAGVIRGQLLICVVNGALTFIGLIIFQVKYSFLLALLAGAFSLIPIFGTIISSVPILVIALVSSPGELAVGRALGMLAWISGIHLLEANILNPKIIGDAAHIHPVIVIFALLAGEHVFGLVGALLAIPATSLVQTLYLHARRRSTVFNRD